MDSTEHQTEAERLLDTGSPNAEQRALVHAILALVAGRPKTRPTTWASTAGVLVLCATIVAVVWLLTR